MRVRRADHKKVATSLRAGRPSRSLTIRTGMRGHAGSPGTGESHFTVKVVSARFAGKSRLERHRMVNDVLAEELKGPVHALAISALAPGRALAPLCGVLRHERGFHRPGVPLLTREHGRSVGNRRRPYG